MNLITCEIESRTLVFVCSFENKKNMNVTYKQRNIYRLLVEFQMRVQHSRQSRCSRELAKIPYPCNTRINLKGYFSLFAIFLNRSQLTYISSSP